MGDEQRSHLDMSRLRPGTDDVMPRAPRRGWILGLVLALLLPAWGASAADLDVFLKEQGDLRISGAVAHVPALREASRRITEKNSKVRISLSGGGSGLGLRRVREGAVDIGNTLSSMTDTQLIHARLKEFHWAHEAVAMVVHPDNPVRELDPAQLAGVYGGKIRNWRELGGSDREIALYTRDEGDSLREVLWDKGLGKGTFSLKARVVASDEAMQASVAQDLAAIGYLALGRVDGSQTVLAIDGVLPSPEAVRDGSYPLARGLYSLTRGKPVGLTRKFLEYLLSDEGQGIVAAQGLVPIR